jgi:hypothetical protein
MGTPRYTMGEAGTAYNVKSAKMKETLTTNWSLIRALRLALGIAFCISAYMQMDMIPAFIGGLLVYQSLLNIGCMGGNCAVPLKKSYKQVEEVDYEELKS